MTETKLNKMTSTTDEIDTYVNKLTTGVIKRHSVGLRSEIRDLIHQTRQHRRLWQKTRIPLYKINVNQLQKRTSKDISKKKRDSWTRYCDHVEICEGEDSVWRKVRSVLNPQKASYNYPTPVTVDEGGIKTISATTSENLERFPSQLESVFTNKIENQVKTDVDAE